MGLKSLLDKWLGEIEHEQHIMRVSPFAYRCLIKETKPNLYALYAACWDNGFKVNGVFAVAR